MQIIFFIIIIFWLYLFTVHWLLGVLAIIAFLGWGAYLNFKDKEKRKRYQNERKKMILPFDAELNEKHPNLNNASIIISNDRKWRLQFLFPGPDRRYNPKTFTIYDNQINDYISALRENFIKYLELKSTLNSSTQVEIKGAKDMTIIIGGYNEGVYVYRRHLSIKTNEEYDNMIESLNYTKSRVEQIISSFVKETKLSS